MPHALFMLVSCLCRIPNSPPLSTMRTDLTLLCSVSLRWYGTCSSCSHTSTCRGAVQGRSKGAGGDWAVGLWWCCACTSAQACRWEWWGCHRWPVLWASQLQLQVLCLHQCVQINIRRGTSPAASAGRVTHTGGTLTLPAMSALRAVSLPDVFVVICRTWI